MSDILAELRAANPAPAEAESHPTAWSDTALLAEIDTRSGIDMSLDQKPKTEQIRPIARTRRWKSVATAASAFAVVVVIIGVVAVLRDSGPPESTLPSDTVATSTTVAPTTTTTTPAPTSPDAATQANLDGFVAAFNSGDPATYEAVFDPEIPRLNHNPDSHTWLNGLEGIMFQYDLQRGMEATIEIGACRSEEGGEIVWCEVTETNALTRATGLDLTIRHGFRFEDQLMVEWQRLLAWITPAVRNATGDLIAWHAETYPEEPTIGGPLGFAQTFETGERVVELIPEWMAARAADGN